MDSDNAVERRKQESFFKILNLSGFAFLGASAIYFSGALLTVWFPVQIVLAWLVADLLSGFIHWFIENVLSRSSTFDALVNPFLDHHARNILEEETWYITFSHLGILAFFFLSTLYVFPFPPFIEGYWVWTVAFSYMAPAIHRLSHRSPAERPRWFARLQSWGVVLPSEHHALHHVKFDRNHCLVSGHADLLLNRFTIRGRQVRGGASEGGVGAVRPRDDHQHG